ncbi:MAG: RDD family protein [Dehalococcoidia bacterium]
MESGEQAQVGAHTASAAPLPPRGRRLFAFLIDLTIAFFVASFLFSSWMNETFAESDANPLIGAWVFLLVLPVALPYYTVCEMLWGRTIGKALLGIKVVPLSGDMKRWRILIRNLVRMTWFIPYLGYPFILFTDAMLVIATEKHQRLGDMLGGTTVIRASILGSHNEESRS